MVLATGTILGLTALAKGGKSIYDYYQNKNNAPSPYAQTEQGKRLAEQQKTGAYSGQIRNEMIGGVNRVASASAETNRANYIGRMSNLLGTSVASQRGLNEIEAGRGRIVANEAGRVGALNAQSKITAGDQLAAGTDQRADQILQYNQQNRQQLTGGLVDAGVGYATGYMANQATVAAQAHEIELAGIKAGAGGGIKAGAGGGTEAARIMSQIQGGESPAPNVPAVLPQDSQSQGGAPTVDTGPSTPSALDTFSPEQPPVTSDQTKQLQDELIAAGYQIDFGSTGSGYGVFGPQTIAALQQYQYATR